MPNNVEAQLTVEIKQLERDKDAQKKIIKHNLGKAKVVEDAEHQLKAQHTHLDVLEGNLKKAQQSKSGPA